MESKSIRLTPNSYAVLALLDQLGEGTSYELKQAIEISIQNFWPVPHTTAYEEPARLAKGGYLTARQEEGGRRRRVYSLTDSGREALVAWSNEPTASPPQLREEAVLKVFAGGSPGPLLEGRIAWHRGKIEELESLLHWVRDASLEGWERSERTLQVGIVYHRKMLEMIEEVMPLSEN